MVSIPFLGEVNEFVLIGGVVLVVIALVALFSGQGRRAVQAPPRRSLVEVASLVLIGLLVVQVVGLLLSPVLGFFGVGFPALKVGTGILMFSVVLGLILALRAVTGQVDFGSTRNVALFVVSLAMVVAAILLVPKILAADGLKGGVSGVVQSIVGP